jgi:hypothetical protein
MLNQSNQYQGGFLIWCRSRYIQPWKEKSWRRKNLTRPRAMRELTNAENRQLKNQKRPVLKQFGNGI